MELQIFADIQKVDDEKRLVYGYASTTALDSQGEKITKEAMAEALPDYLKFSNIREMHQASAVGTAENVDVNDKGIYLAAKIVDDNAWKKVKAGVYKGFSIGGKSLSKVDNVIEKLRISEISLVDRPANPECVIELYKAEGLNEQNADDTKTENENTREDSKSKESESTSNEQKSEGEKSQESVIDSDTPRAATVQEKSQKSHDLKKGMYDVAQLACLIDQLNGLKAFAEWEATAEGDNSPVPAKLKDAVNSLGEILTEMVAEETKELTEDDNDDDEIVTDVAYSEKTKDVQKAGARNSKGDGERIQKMHDIATELGADCGGADSVKSQHAALDDIKKIDDLQSNIQKLEDEKTQLQKRVTELEALPQPAKGVLRAINKGEDINTGQEEDFSKMESPQEIIKAIHKKPMPYQQFLNK